MDDGVGSEAAQDLEQVVGVGDVGLDVLDAVEPVARAPQVHDRNGAARPVALQQAHDVVTQEAVAPYHEHVAQAGLLLLLVLLHSHGARDRERERERARGGGYVEGSVGCTSTCGCIREIVCVVSVREEGREIEAKSGR